jgi:hypothetical protein
MTKKDLIEYVKAELTASCSLPFTPPDAEIERIIDIESRWLYREYRDASYTFWYLLNKQYYQTPEWKATRTFQLPECVIGVKVVYELTAGQRVFGINDPDMKFDRLMAADLYLSPLSSDQITYRTMQWSFWDMMRQFNLRDIQFSFNLNTRRIVILGRDPQMSLYVSTINKIPEEEFYEDPLVIKWMTATAKKSLARILGTFNYNLFGNVTVNYEQWRTEANEELKELKEKIVGDNSTDWFMMVN